MRPRGIGAVGARVVAGARTSRGKADRPVMAVVLLGAGPDQQVPDIRQHMASQPHIIIDARRSAWTR